MTEMRNNKGQFIKGHVYLGFKGWKHSKESKEKMREAHLGKKHSKDVREKIKKARTGKTYEEIYGMKKSKEIKEKQSKVRLGKKLSWIGHNKPHTKKSKKLISKAQKGRKPWNKGLSKETDERIARASLKMSKAHLGVKLSKEHIKSAMNRRIPSSLEDKFLKIIDKHSLPYIYVGDGSFLIENCNPDFINIDGKKIAIEVYCRFYKQIDKRNIEDWKKRRQDIFKKYGWRILFFDEIALNNERNVLNILEV